MNQPRIPKKISLKKTTDEIINRGDCCIIENLYYNEDKIEPHPAIILRCPFCRMDIASTRSHIITKNTSWFLKVFGIKKETITISPMIQCPYVPTHKFYIKKDKIKIIT